MEINVYYWHFFSKATSIPLSSRLTDNTLTELIFLLLRGAQFRQCMTQHNKVS